MSTAYYIVLDQENVDFDTFVNGKYLADEADKLNDFCALHNLKTIDSFLSQDPGDFLDEDMSGFEQQWFTAAEGLDWIDRFVQKLSEEPTMFKKENVLSDLLECREVLENAANANARWCLHVDF